MQLIFQHRLNSFTIGYISPKLPTNKQLCVVAARGCRTVANSFSPPLRPMVHTPRVTISKNVVRVTAAVHQEQTERGQFQWNRDKDQISGTQLW